MRQKIYISNIDSAIGRQLAQQLRDDHVKLNESRMIVGTAAVCCPCAPGVYRYIDFVKEFSLACQAALTSDVVIVDLRNPSSQAETLLRLMREDRKSVRKIVGISSHLTWSGSKVMIYQPFEKLAARVLEGKPFEKIVYTSEMYELRVAAPSHSKHYQLENMLLSMDTAKCQVAIICAGVVYGKDNFELQETIFQADEQEEMVLYGDGNNTVPMTNIEELCKQIGQFVNSNTILPKYSILIDEQCPTQGQLVAIVATELGNAKPRTFVDSLQLDEEGLKFGSDVKVTRSTIFANNSIYSFQSYCAQGSLLRDLYEYTTMRPRQALISETDLGIISNITWEQLGKCCRVITQKDISLVCHELAEKQRNSQPQAVPSKNQKVTVEDVEQKYAAEAVHCLLKDMKMKSYVVCLNNYCRQFVKSEYAFNGFTVLSAEENAGSLAVNQRQFDKYFRIRHAKSCEQIHSVEEKDSPLMEKLEETAAQPKEVMGSRPHHQDNKQCLLEQYLLDKVLIYVSQAKYQLQQESKEGNLRHLIDKLQTIFKRKNYRRCIAAAQ